MDPTPSLPPSLTGPQPGPRPQPPGHAPLMEAARALEATFLAQMLAHAGLGDTPEAFGGGPGEEQFAAQLRQEQARVMVAAGGIGLAKTLFDAMVARDEPL